MDEASKADKFFGDDDEGEETKVNKEDSGKKRSGKKKKNAKQMFFEELKDTEDKTEVAEEEQVMASENVYELV